MDNRTRNAILTLAGRLDSACATLEAARADRDRLINEHHARGNVSSPEETATFHDACAKFFRARARAQWLHQALQTLSQGAE